MNRAPLLSLLRVEAQSRWDAAVAGAEASNPAQAEACRRARLEAMAAWDDALASSSLPAAREHVETARDLAARWSTDVGEREALLVMAGLG